MLLIINLSSGRLMQQRDLPDTVQLEAVKTKVIEIIRYDHIELTFKRVVVSHGGKWQWERIYV